MHVLVPIDGEIIATVDDNVLLATVDIILLDWNNRGRGLGIVLEKWRYAW